MQIELSVKGRNFEPSDVFRQHVTRKVSGLGKYLNGPADVRVVVQCEKHAARAEVHIKSGRATVWARARAEEPGQAVDEAISRIDEQLRRRKDRLKTRKGREASSRLLSG